MKNIYKKLIFKILIIGYGTILGLFVLGSIIVSVIRYMPKTESCIPQLTIQELEKVYNLVGKREKLPDIAKIDLSKFKFGKTEPFH